MTTEQTFPLQYQYCPTCGQELEERLLETEERPRLVCPEGHILYINPKIVVGAILENEDRVLLVRRGIEPRIGYWTFPGGFMEVDETVEECALRETQEEIGVRARIDGLVGLYSRPVPHGPGILSVVLRGAVIDGDACLSREVQEVRWFAPDEIPWADLAYDTVHWALRDWLNQRSR
ncbi:MAG TPA: NUDIX domain-containing protein [Dehalococcoidia bacterium]|nr:NUDIX domain-containing protein [Dehalococcoidia bacterium]